MIDKSSGSRQSLNRILDTVGGLLWYRPSLKFWRWEAPTPNVVLEGGSVACPLNRAGRQSCRQCEPSEEPCPR